jgi:hypothetical protein
VNIRENAPETGDSTPTRPVEQVRYCAKEKVLDTPFGHAARWSPWSWRSQLDIWFQLVKIRVTK